MAHTYYHRNANGGVGDIIGQAECTYEGETSQEPIYSRGYYSASYNTDGMDDKCIDKLDKLIAKFQEKFYEALEEYE